MRRITRICLLESCRLVCSRGLFIARLRVLFVSLLRVYGATSLRSAQLHAKQADLATETLRAWCRIQAFGKAMKQRAYKELMQADAELEEAVAGVRARATHTHTHTLPPTHAHAHRPCTALHIM